jgi:hypothetical protein
VQIGTGEGKSVTLAVCSAVMALIGFDVFCVCYSKHLSERDYSNFEKLFDILKIKEKIFYGTFKEICEYTINANGDIRNLTLNQINGQSKNVENSKKQKLSPRILLIDEVDVFFTKDFYGNSYNPITKLTDQRISNLIHDVWNFQNNNLNLSPCESLNRIKIACKNLAEFRRF